MSLNFSISDLCFRPEAAIVECLIRLHDSQSAGCLLKTQIPDAAAHLPQIMSFSECGDMDRVPSVSLCIGGQYASFQELETSILHPVD